MRSTWFAVLLLGCSACAHPPPPAVTPGAPVEVARAPEPPPAKVASVGLEVITSPSLVRVDKEQEIIVRVRARGLPAPSRKRPSLNVALVVDTSGSMEGPAIEQARVACATLVDLLGEGDAVSIVAFGSRAEVIVPAVRVSGKSRDVAKKAIKEIRAAGTTDMAAGLGAGLGQVQALLAPDGINRIVLLGDGVPNEAPPVVALADQARAQHIPITALGLGADFDETLMASLAQRSGGTFHFVDDASRVVTVFREAISRMERLVARSARLQVTPGPGVTIEEVIGVPASPAGRGVVIALGDLTEGQTRDVLLRLRARGKHNGASIELLDVVAHHTLPEGGPELTASKFAALQGSTEEGKLRDAADAEIERQALGLRVASGIVTAIARAREGDVNGARKLLDATIKLANDGARRFGDKSLSAKAEEMLKLRRTLPSLAPPPEPPSASRPHPGTLASPPPPKASPAEAMGLKSAHGDSIRELQGQ